MSGSQSVDVPNGIDTHCASPGLGECEPVARQRMSSVIDLLAHHPDVLERCLRQANDPLPVVQPRTIELVVLCEVTEEAVDIARFKFRVSQDRKEIRFGGCGRGGEMDEKG